MADDAPLDHVLRFEPPWRDARKTVCGRPVADVASVVERDVLLAKVRDQGKQRASFTTCMTCWDRAQYAQPWDFAPSSVLNREVRHSGYASTRQDAELDREMRALTLLWEEHREEFDAIMQGLGEVNDLAEHRAQKRRGRTAR